MLACWDARTRSRQSGRHRGPHCSKGPNRQRPMAFVGPEHAHALLPLCSTCGARLRRRKIVTPRCDGTPNGSWHRVASVPSETTQLIGVIESALRPTKSGGDRERSLVCEPLKKAVQLRGAKPGRPSSGLRARVRYYTSRAPPAWAHEEGVVAKVRKIPMSTTMSRVMPY